MKKVVTLKVEEAELAEWTLWAHEAEMSLSEWIRKSCREAQPIKTVDEQAWAVGAAKEATNDSEGKIPVADTNDDLLPRGFEEADPVAGVPAIKPKKPVQAVAPGYVIINGKRLCSFCARKRVPCCRECIKYNAVSVVEEP